MFFQVTSKWNKEHFHTLLTGDHGLAALQNILSGSRNNKRKYPDSSQCTTPRSSCSLSSASTQAAAAAAAVPPCVMETLAKLGHPSSLRVVQDFRSRPDHAKGTDCKTGQVLALRGYPCVVHALLHNKTKSHKKNCSYLWIPSSAGSGGDNAKTTESYLKCLDPECKQAAQRHWDVCGHAGTMPKLDKNGWGSLSSCVSKLLGKH